MGNNKCSTSVWRLTALTINLTILQGRGKGVGNPACIDVNSHVQLATLHRTGKNNTLLAVAKWDTVVVVADVKLGMLCI